MTNTNLKVLLLLCVFRILNVFVIQTQFDPDEYWQQLEPAYCRVFTRSGQSCPGLTWEWKRRSSSLEVNSMSDLIDIGMKGPVRSYASILPTLIFYHTIKTLGLDTSWLVSRGPVFLNAILVAAPTDWSVWYLSRWMVTKPRVEESSFYRWCAFCSLSSWFMAYALVRTYSNSLETVLLMISFCLVAPELLDDLKSPYPHRMARGACAFFLGGWSCAIRFTSLAAFVPMGVLLSIQSSPRSIRSIVSYLVGICAVFGILGLACTLALDRHLYGFAVFPLLGNFHFNVLLGNGRLYGTHPFHWYLTAGIPAIAGMLTPFLVLDLLACNRWSRGRRNIWFICGCYILAHSFSEHKEFRFLLPILPLFCLLCGEGVRNFAERSTIRLYLLVVGAAANLGVVLYLGLVHQRGPIEVNRRIIEIVKHEPQTYSIHYLMGCHSTPLLSHLHSPPIRIEPWTLDCSPSCRADPNTLCESELFAKDPGKFMEETYFRCSDFEEGSCVTDLRILYPDFIVARAEDLPAMQSRIASMNMEEVGRFVNGINGIQLENQFALGHKALDDKTCSTSTFLAGSFPIVLSFDEIVLFKNRQIHPRY